MTGINRELPRISDKFGMIVCTPAAPGQLPALWELGKGTERMIRHAEAADLPRILEIYVFARRFMAENGNPHQWAGGFPPETLLRQDIAQRQLFVREEDSCICGVFAFIIGEEAAYARIEGGGWLSSSPYGTIHRIAGDGSRRGLLREAVAFCEKQIAHLRIDTHPDNRIMQHLIEKNGFRKCGMISVRGGLRCAYEKLGKGV